MVVVFIALLLFINVSYGIVYCVSGRRCVRSRAPSAYRCVREPVPELTVLVVFHSLGYSWRWLGEGFRIGGSLGQNGTECHKARWLFQCPLHVSSNTRYLHVTSCAYFWLIVTLLLLLYWKSNNNLRMVFTTAHYTMPRRDEQSLHCSISRSLWLLMYNALVGNYVIIWFNYSTMNSLSKV